MPGLKVPPLFATLSPYTPHHSLGLSAESVSPLIQGFFWTSLASMWKQVDWLILPGASGYLYFGFCWVIATRQLVWCPGRNSGQGAQYWFCCLGLCGLGQVSVSDGASACPFVSWRSWFNYLPVETVIIPLVLLSGFEGKQTPKQEAKMGRETFKVKSKCLYWTLLCKALLLWHETAFHWGHRDVLFMLYFIILWIFWILKQTRNTLCWPWKSQGAWRSIVSIPVFGKWFDSLVSGVNFPPDSYA